MILLNGRIVTQHPSHPRATAIAVQDDAIRAVGTDDELLDLIGSGEERVDLEGRTVVPGLIDAHVHLHWYAQRLQWVNLIGVASLEEVLTRVRARAARTPAGEWVLGRGWNQNLWPRQRFPAASDLDRIAPGHPVYLIAQSGHAGWVNSLALQLAGVTPERPDPPGAQIQRDAHGQPTGILFEEGAMELVKNTLGEPPAAEAAEAIEQAIPDFWQAGVTGVHCMDKGVAWHAVRHLHRSGKLGLRVVKYLNRDDLDEAISLGVRSGSGDDWLRIGGLKLYADGALGVRTAAMLEPYPGEPENRGILTLEREQLQEQCLRASAAGLSVAVHAIGDRANRMVLDVLETVPAVAAVPHRIEHVQLLHPADAGRLAALDVTASVQPVHAPSDMEMAERHWGDRTAFAYAYRTLRDHGTHMAFGSDAPVEPFAPLVGIHAAVTRRRLDGSPAPDGWHPEQRLTVPQALQGFTLGAAQAAGMGDRLGTLAPGKLADLVVLDGDILALDPAEIPSTRVMGTMIGGRWVMPLS